MKGDPARRVISAVLQPLARADGTLRDVVWTLDLECGHVRTRRARPTSAHGFSPPQCQIPSVTFWFAAAPKSLPCDMCGYLARKAPEVPGPSPMARSILGPSWTRCAACGAGYSTDDTPRCPKCPRKEA